MITKESEVLYCFASKPWRRYSFTELIKESGKNSKSYLASVLNKFVKDSVLKREKIGSVPVYSLNLASTKARTFAGFVLEHYGWKTNRLPYAELQSAMDKIPSQDYVFIITGSYASGKQGKGSDIDVVVLVDDTVRTKRVYAELTHFCEMSIPQIHLYVFRNKEFIEMLSAKEESYGKETVKNNLIIAGGQVYMKIVWEAIRHGFNG
jgi:predicted nucleotidyltransferase